MAIAELKGGRIPIKMWARPESVESVALDQLRNAARLPWAVHHVAVMPDVHFGKGATVGSVLALRGAVAPAAVGVDIGCGMNAVRTSLTAEDLPGSLAPLRRDIEAAVPVGFNRHEEIPKVIAESEDVGALFEEFGGLAPQVQRLRGRAMQQIGTLGGGNHFIEVCLGIEVCPCGGASSACSACRGGGRVERVWLMLHSGSRNIGKELAEIHISVAKSLVHNQTAEVPDRDLAVFLAGTPEMAAYRRDLFWAQRYAFANRSAMCALAQRVVRHHFPRARFDEPILCHHNYVSEEVHFGEELLVTRKGAISAREGEMGIIPGSMGTRSYIVRGRGNPESFCSASHGAGRRMSRGAAKRTFTLKDLRAQTTGVECRKDEGVLDEIPGAYKAIEDVMRDQADLVEIVAELRAVVCVKG